MKKMKLAILFASILAGGAAYATNMHKDCIPTQFKGGDNMLHPIVSDYTCPSSSDICTYDDAGAPCQLDGTFTPR